MNSTKEMEWLSSHRAVVEPSVTARAIEVDTALLCFSPGAYQALVDAFALDAGRESPPFPGALQGILGSRLAIYQAHFGAPAAGSLMEALVASGVGHFVMLGMAGSISPNCRIGDVVVPTWGIREEGTSYHYLSPDAPCRVAEASLQQIRTRLEGIDFKEGGVWTTDAPYRETVDKVQAYARQGVLAVEMECTALMSIGLYRGVDFAAVLVISDELFTGQWVRGFDDDRLKESEARICRNLSKRP